MTDKDQAFNFDGYKRFILDELEPARNQRNKYICPICNSGTGKNRTAAFTVNQDYTGHCYACGFHGDIFDLYVKRDRIEADEARKCVVEKYGNGSTQRKDSHAKSYKTQKQAEQDFTEYIKSCASAYKGSPAETYLVSRGITEETATAYNLGYDASKNAVVIPYPNENYYITRSINGKAYRKPTGTTEPIFNASALNAERVFITEGQIDALSIIQAGGNACAIGGSGIHKLEDISISGKPYIFADNDEAGERTAQSIREILKQKGIKAFIVRPIASCKDANDMLIGFPDELKELIADPSSSEEEERSAYLAKSAGMESLTVLQNDRAQTFCVSTGFFLLDDALGGGIYEGLYVLGAVSSLGKTTFALQLADQIAKGGTDILFFSLEMQQEELILKSLSRLTYELSNGATSNAKTTRGLSDPQRRDRYNEKEWELVANASAEYHDYGSRIWIDEGLGNIGTSEIDRRIQEHIDNTGRKPVVFIDYLQILQTPDVRMTDKQATDKNIFNLKRISRKYKLPIFAISSLNRENYSQGMNMAAFKESGAIEYSSDVLMGLQPQGMGDGASDADRKSNRQTMKDCKANSVREIELVVLKNRHGTANANVSFRYLPAFNAFEEERN